MSAVSAGAVADSVRASGAYLIEARRVFGWEDLLTAKAPADEIALVLDQLATMMRAGVGVPDAFVAVGRSTSDEAIAAALADVAGRVSAGASLEAALDAHPYVFDGLLVASVRAAPDPGAVQLAFSRRAEAIVLREELAKKLRSAAAYPLFLLGLAALVLTFLVLQVVPSIGRLYDEAGTALPALTRVTLTMTAFLRENAGGILFGGLFLALAVTVAYRTERGGRAIDAVIARIPIVGHAWLSHPWIGWALTIADALSAGVPLQNAIRMASSVVARPRLAAALAKVADDVERGTDLAAAIRARVTTCPPLISGAIALPAKGADLADLLRGAARSESSRVSWALQRLTRSVEPVLMVAVGIVIGAIVVSLYLPVLSLVETL